MRSLIIIVRRKRGAPNYDEANEETVSDWDKDREVDKNG